MSLGWDTHTHTQDSGFRPNLEQRSCSSRLGLKGSLWINPETQPAKMDRLLAKSSSSVALLRIPSLLLQHALAHGSWSRGPRAQSLYVKHPAQRACLKEKDAKRASLPVMSLLAPA